MSLDVMLKELISICDRMEQGLPLEETMKLYERGVELSNAIDDAIKQAEQVVEVLNPNGTRERFQRADKTLVK